MAFKMRTSKPGAGNKYYNNGNNGGYSWCVKQSHSFFRGGQFFKFFFKFF